MSILKVFNKALFLNFYINFNLCHFFIHVEICRNLKLLSNLTDYVYVI